MVEENRSEKQEHKHSESKNVETSFSSTKKEGSFLGNLRENPWIVSTAVLAVVLIVVLIVYGGNTTGNVISGDEAGQNLVSYIGASGTQASVTSIEQEGTLYKAMVDVEGQEMPVYITMDGKFGIVQPIPLTLDLTQTGSNDTGTQTAAPEVPKSDKPVVELFVMSYCPYGTQIEKGIIPVVQTLGNKIDFKLKFVNYAMHPTSGEVEENLRQYCIQKDQNSKFMDYLGCFLEAGDSKSCLTSAKIDTKKLDTCYAATDKEFSVIKNLDDKSLWLSGSYPKFLINDAENKEYGVQGSPTLVINGVQASAGRDADSLLKEICGAFNTAPSECSTDLSTLGTPSAGFGFDAAATGAATTAQCG